VIAICLRDKNNKRFNFNWLIFINGLIKRNIFLVIGNTFYFSLKIENTVKKSILLHKIGSYN